MLIRKIHPRDSSDTSDIIYMEMEYIDYPFNDSGVETRVQFEIYDASMNILRRHKFTYVLPSNMNVHVGIIFEEISKSYRVFYVDNKVVRDDSVLFSNMKWENDIPPTKAPKEMYIDDEGYLIY